MMYFLYDDIFLLQIVFVWLIGGIEIRVNLIGNFFDVNFGAVSIKTQCSILDVIDVLWVNFGLWQIVFFEIF
jgi:hypothetical protein